MKHGLGLNKILGTIHTYPTLAEANKYAAGDWKRAHAPQKLLEWVRPLPRVGAGMTIDRRDLLLGVAAVALALRSQAQAFDHAHAAWTALLSKHVVLLRSGQASQVDYRGSRR